MFTAAFYLKKHQHDKHHVFLSQLDGGAESESESDKTEGDSEREYFASEAEIRAEIRKGNYSVEAYIGNLKSENGFWTLTDGYLVILEEEGSNLKDVKPENLVYLKMLFKEIDNRKQIATVCMKCNTSAVCDALINSSETKLTDIFLKKTLVNCNHAQVSKTVYKHENVVNAEQSFSKCFTIKSNEKEHISACFDGKTFATVVCRLSRGSRKGKCLSCKGDMCRHIKAWNAEVRTQILEVNDNTPDGSEEMEIDTDENEDSEDNCEKENVCKPKLKFPPSASTQQMFKTMDSMVYDECEHFVDNFVEGVCADHNNPWSTEEPVAAGWSFSNNVIISHSKFVTKKERRVFFRCTEGVKCKCKLFYEGEDDFLLRIGGSIKHKTRTVNLVSYSLLIEYTISFMETGQSIRGFHRSHKAKCKLVFGMEEEEIIDLKAWQKAVNRFWLEVLEIDMKDTYVCKSCGELPPVLVFDGVTMGIGMDKILKFREKMKKLTARKSRKVLGGTKFSERVFIRMAKNRALLRDAAEKKVWPRREDIADNIGEDLGMVQFWTMVQHLDQSLPPGDGIIQLMHNLSAKTSTTSLFQIIDIPLLQNVIAFLQGDLNLDFIGCSTEDQMKLNERMMEKYPTFTRMLRALASPSRRLENAVATFLASVVKQSILVFENSAQRTSDDYISEEKEVRSEVFPNFPRLRKRAEYQKNCKKEDRESFKDICSKTYPNHKKLSPGLLIMTCACPQKCVYGFLMMLDGESPMMVFDIIMSRFPPNYNPHILYDNSCKTKEYGLNREPRRFMNIQITTDKFHEENHQKCAESFKTSEYPNLSDCNSEACEQTNRILRRISSSSTYMNIEIFLKSISLFLGYQNMTKKG